jgi:hypothetical protein
VKRFLKSDQTSTLTSSSSNKIKRDNVSSVKIESATGTLNLVSNSKSTKLRRCGENYLSLGFTKTPINGEERPQCVVRLTILASNSMKPNKLRRHLETKHAELINKPKEFFTRKHISFQSTQHLKKLQLCLSKLF